MSAIEALAPSPVQPFGEGSHVYLVDGSGYIFRAFYALPPLSRPSDGLPVGAIHGFCSMLWGLIQDSRKDGGPTHVAVVFDAGRATFRTELYEAYKAHRRPMPDDLVPQLPLIRDAVHAFGVVHTEQAGFEADDLIATYARQAVAAGGEATIVSVDKDLMQLVGPGICMHDPVLHKHIGPDEVMAKFGVPPERVIDVQALCGDTADNVPGVPSIGIKKAAALINTYGDLDGLLANMHDLRRGKQRDQLIEHAEMARLSRDLVTLRTDVPVAHPLDSMAVRRPRMATLMGFLQAMEFQTLTHRIQHELPRL